MDISYNEIKKMEMKRAERLIESLENSKDPATRYKVRRPVTDLKHMFETSVELYGENIAFRQKFKKDGEYVGITYNEAYDDVRGLGTELIALGQKGKRVAVIGETCYQWETSYLATVCSIGVVVPLDKELNETQLEYLVKDSGVSTVIFDSKYEDIFMRLKNSGETKIELLINFDNTKTESVLEWRNVIEEGKKKVARGDKSFEEAQVIADDLSVILYTSGTTGVAKGVMATQSNLCFELMVAPTMIKATDKDVFFSVLPVHHTYEATAGFLMPLYLGASIAFCEGLKHVVKNLEEVKPTIMLGVPALIETLYKKIWKSIKKQKKEGLIKGLLLINRGTSRIKLDISKPFVKKILALFGGNMRLMISGGAAIDPAILQFFNDLGITSVQGYGLTECAPMAAINPDKPSMMKHASAGKVLFGTEVKIANPDESGIGEICIKGPHIMLGYYNNEEATNEVLKDGWFHSGDLGYLDKDNYVFVTGRQKNVIIAKNGKNVFPEELEYYLNKSTFIDESFVWSMEDEGVNDTSISATVTLDMEEVETEIGATPTEENVKTLIWNEVDKVNAELPSYKQIVKLFIRKEPFIKTTAKKIKRFEKENRK